MLVINLLLNLLYLPLLFSITIHIKLNINSCQDVKQKPVKYYNTQFIFNF